MTTTTEIQHPEIRDKWEARICMQPLNDQVNTLEDIQRQLDDTKAQIAKLSEKLAMHERDAAYVAQIIASKLPPAVIAEARREPQERTKQ